MKNIENIRFYKNSREDMIIWNVQDIIDKMVLKEY